MCARQTLLEAVLEVGRDRCLLGHSELDAFEVVQGRVRRAEEGVVEYGKCLRFYEVKARGGADVVGDIAQLGGGDARDERQQLANIVLRDLIGVRMLSEQAQITAIQELSNAYLKRWPAMMPGQTAPNPHVLVVALREVAGLLQQLGNAPTPVQVGTNEQQLGYVC